jgi:hypothetical protein
VSNKKSAKDLQSVWQQARSVRIKGITEALFESEHRKNRKNYRNTLSDAVQAEILIRLNGHKPA